MFSFRPPFSPQTRYRTSLCHMGVCTSSISSKIRVQPSREKPDQKKSQRNLAWTRGLAFKVFYRWSESWYGTREPLQSWTTCRWHTAWHFQLSRPTQSYNWRRGHGLSEPPEIQVRAKCPRPNCRYLASGCRERKFVHLDAIEAYKRFVAEHTFFSRQSWKKNCRNLRSKKIF